MMADENIMSLIQNLFIEENNLVNNQHIDLNDNLVGSNFNAITKSLDNDLNSKKLLIKQLNSQLNNNQTNQQNSSALMHAVNLTHSQNASSFYNDLTANPLLRNLTMKDNELDLNDDLLFGNKIFSLNDQSQLKTNYDLLNNNTTPTNQNQSQSNEQQNRSIKDLPISPLSECSFKSNLLTPGGPTSVSTKSTNLYNNFGILNNNSNNVLLQQQPNNSSLVSTANLIANNLINSPISSNNNSILNSNQSGSASLSHQNSSTPSSFADLILGCDDSGLGQNFNNYGLNGLNVVQRAAQFTNDTTNHSTLIKGQKLNTFNFDACTSPDSFIYTEEDRFESQIRSLANEIHSTIQLHMNGLHMRRESLLQQLEHIKKIYFDVLRKKKAALNGTNKQQQQQLFTKIDQQANKQLEKFILPSITFNKPDSTIYKAISTLGFLNTPAFGPFCKASGDGLEFAVPGVNSQFTIETRNCFNDELLVGRESISIEILALFNDNPTDQTTMNSELNSSNATSTTNNSLKSMNEKSNSLLLDYTSKSMIPHTFFDHNNGKYTVNYNVPILKSIPQELVVKISVNSLPINDSPIRVPVRTQKRQNWKLATTFGSEGNAIGCLCRPWGVAVVKMPSQLLMNYSNNLLQQNSNVNGQSTTINDQLPTIETTILNQQQTSSPTLTNSTSTNSSSSSDKSQQQQPQSTDQHYLIGIADRSNNRIQLLDYNSKTQQINVINVFGSGPGTRAGMFDRPAGICINLSLGHIIVADKDNHRIQVFSLTGRYLFKFGEKGNRIGQMCYPWGVDCCESNHQIAISDTRNRRIQIFTPYGQYVNHISLLLDSPRGVQFLPDKRLVVSDFNKHRILIFDKYICNPNLKDAMNNELNSFSNLNSPKIIGFGEGTAWGEFLRPQGIAVSGNSIFCADSRNNRICIYNMLTQTFEYLSEELGLDRPSDLSVIDENLLIIIDFGNNRLQILQR